MMKYKITKNTIITGFCVLLLVISAIFNIYGNNKEYTVKQGSQVNLDKETIENETLDKKAIKSDESSSDIDKKESDDIFEQQNQDILQENTFVTVFISGEVLNSKVITIEKGKRLVDAIEFCGGLTEKANINAVNLAVILEEEQHYIIPAIGEELNYDSSNSSLSSNSNSQEVLVDINKSDIEKLKTLPGVGDVLAQRIIDKREELGGFKSIDQLNDVSGIGDKKFLDIKDKVKIK